MVLDSPFFSFIFKVSAFNPAKEKTTLIACVGTDREYFPSVLVTVATGKPKTETLAPSSALPVESVTVPEIVACCGYGLKAKSHKAKAQRGFCGGSKMFLKN